MQKSGRNSHDACEIIEEGERNFWNGIIGMGGWKLDSCYFSPLVIVTVGWLWDLNKLCARSLSWVDSCVFVVVRSQSQLNRSTYSTLLALNFTIPIIVKSTQTSNPFSKITDTPWLPRLKRSPPPTLQRQLITRSTTNRIMKSLHPLLRKEMKQEISTPISSTQAWC